MQTDIENVELREMRKAKRGIEMSYRKVGYIEQIYYIFKYWLRERITELKRKRKNGGSGGGRQTTD